MTMAHLCGHDCEQVCGDEADRLTRRADALAAELREVEERERALTEALWAAKGWIESDRDEALNEDTYSAATYDCANELLERIDAALARGGAPAAKETT